MAKRNIMFKNIATYLETEFDMEKGEARILAKQALVENRNINANSSKPFEVPLCGDEEELDCYFQCI